MYAAGASSLDNGLASKDGSGNNRYSHVGLIPLENEYVWNWHCLQLVPLSLERKGEEV
jgi:hypothetical protein